MGMPSRWHVHSSRIVYSKNYDQKAFQKLKCQNSKDIKKAFDRALAFCYKRDHRSYAAILNNTASKHNKGNIGSQKEANGISLKRDILCSGHKQDLGSRIVVDSQNDFKNSE